VAKLGAAFALAALGLADEPREDHACYVAHWLGLLLGDRSAILTAAGKDFRFHQVAPPGRTLNRRGPWVTFPRRYPPE
jgi:antirestriction protein ArdC